MGPGLRFKSRILRLCLYLRKGVYVPLRALFLVFYYRISALVLLRFNTALLSVVFMFNLHLAISI